MADQDDASLRLELFVRDLRVSVAFYRDVLGFAQERADYDYAVMRCGRAVLGLGLLKDLPASHPFAAGLSSQKGVGVEIVIEVGDVATAYDRVLASKYAVASPLRGRPWGLTDFRVVDPDGYYLRITSR